MAAAFVDTSAICALLVPEDANHARARSAIEELQHEAVDLVSSSFVLHETIALLQARVGIQGVRWFLLDVAPLMDVVWVDAAVYGRAAAALLAAGSREISLTDWTSFDIMRGRDIEEAYPFDPHFLDQGFRTRPRL